MCNDKVTSNVNASKRIQIVLLFTMRCAAEHFNRHKFDAKKEYNNNNNNLEINVKYIFGLVLTSDRGLKRQNQNK